MTESWLNLMRLEAARVGWHRKPNRIGLVDSYDPKTHSVKVRLQPEDPETPQNALTGWIPLTGIAVGKGFGIFAAPNVGDQVELSFQEGDHLSARVVARHWSEADPPVELKAGEYALVHGKGSYAKWLEDGSVTLAGPGGQPMPGGRDESGKASTVTIDKDNKVAVNAPQADVTVQSGKDIRIAPGGAIYMG